MMNPQLLAHTAKIREYCDYLDEHVTNVLTAWKLVQACCQDLRFIYDDYVFGLIDAEVLHHDLSKIDPEEFIHYQREFYPVGKKESPGFAAAWERHKACNDHHWQTWTTREYWNPYEVEVHCVHMVLDWIAMSIRYGDTALAYYKKQRDYMDLPEWADKFVLEILDRVYPERDGRLPDEP